MILIVLFVIGCIAAAVVGVGAGLAAYDILYRR